MSSVPADQRPIERGQLHSLLIPRIGLLRGYLASRIPPSLRDALSADDILQEVWLAVYRTGENFVPRVEAGFDRWLQKLVHSKLVDAVRRARCIRRGGDPRYVRNGPRSPVSFTDALASLRDNGRTPSRDVHMMETAHTLLIGLRQLHPRQREAIQLRFLQGLSNRETAEQMNTTEKSVEDLLYRGLRVLREVLGPAARYFTATSEDSGSC